MTDLTEKWKVGELPCCNDKNEWLSYYVRHKDGVIYADSYWRGQWGISDRNYIDEVLAQVPSYEELQALKEENARIKELLKEVKEFIEEENPKDYTIMSERMDELLIKIEEVLK